MLIIRATPTASEKYTPNLLPARINHNGPISSSTHYWAPAPDATGTLHAHFRGRHLHGTAVPVPENYTGAVMRITDKLAPPPPAVGDTGMDDEGEDEGEQEEVKIAEVLGGFEEMVVWGHAETVGEDDQFVRGIREWVGFAEAVHGEEGREEKGEGVKQT